MILVVIPDLYTLNPKQGPSALQEQRARLAAATVSPPRGRWRRRESSSSGYLLVAAAAGRMRERQAAALGQRRAAAAGPEQEEAPSESEVAIEDADADDASRPAEGAPKARLPCSSVAVQPPLRWLQAHTASVCEALQRSHGPGSDVTGSLRARQCSGRQCSAPAAQQVFAMQCHLSSGHLHGVSLVSHGPCADADAWERMRRRFATSVQPRARRYGARWASRPCATPAACGGSVQRLRTTCARSEPGGWLCKPLTGSALFARLLL